MIYRKVADADPSVAAYQNELARTLFNLGFVQREEGRLAEALRSHTMALEIYQALADSSGDVALSHYNLGLVERDALRPADAIRRFEQAIGLWSTQGNLSPEILFCKAGGLAQISGLTRDAKRSEAAGEQAMRDLRQAIEAGYRCSSPIEERELDPLRSRPGFKQLMMDSAFPADPFALDR